MREIKRLNAGMSLTQAMTPVVYRFNRHVELGGIQTSAFIVFKERSEV